MADNNHDEKNPQKPKTPQTPFGGWASAPPKSQSNDKQNGAPRAVVSNEDGSQRPAEAEDLAAPKYDATQTAPKEQPKIRSFSDTFGTLNEPTPYPPSLSDDTDEEEDDIATETVEAAASGQEPDASPEEENEEAAELLSQPPAPEQDPFAWTPEEAPSASEPRRNLGSGESWMKANTSYEELQSSTRAALEAAEHDPAEDVIVQEVTPTINPYTFNKGEEWTAPPMDADTLASVDADPQNIPITEEEKPSFEFTASVTPQEEEEPEDETQPLSPFNFTSYEETVEAEEPAAPMQTQAEDTPTAETATEEAVSLPQENQEEETESASTVTIAAEDTPQGLSEPAPAASGLEPDSQPASSGTNFQLYKPVVPAAAPMPEEFALHPEEANLLGEANVAPATEPSLPDAAVTDAAADISFPAASEEPLPEESPALAESPADDQDIPLPEAYTPPSPEETPLPEQPIGQETSESKANTAPISELPAAHEHGNGADFGVTTEPEATDDFGGGAGEFPDAALATAQADIPAAPEMHEPSLSEPMAQDYPAQAAPAGGGTENNSHSNEEIQAILQSHALWLDSRGRDGRRANFRNASLPHCDLSNSRLAEASFRGANLTGVNFSGSDIRGADMSEAQLSNANFSAASLAGAIFSRTDLRNAVFQQADLQAADFSGAFLTGAVLAGLNLSGTVLLDADLQSADLTQTSLIGANLRGANMTYANLTAANLSNANCRDVRFDQGILDGAVFEGANLKNASVQGASLLGTDLSSAGETSPEQRQETIQAEKEQLLQEWQRLKEHEAQVQHLQASIQQREMALHNDRVNAERGRRELQTQYESLEKLIHKTHEVMNRHRIHDRQFKYFGVCWFIFTVLIAVTVMMFVGALELNELDWLELSIVFGGCALIMGLFIATTVRSIKLSNNLKQLLDMYEQQMPSSDKTGH